MVKRAVSFLIVSVLLPAFCLPNVAFAEAEAYRIGREDVLEISVWQSPDLSKALPVLSDGTIEYPILGKIPALGLTPQELAKSLREKLAQGYVNEPKVNVTVKEYNSKKILVFGEVEKPGLYKLKGPIPLLELLFMVGGVKEDAKRMTVIRSPMNSPDAVPSALLPAAPEAGPDSEPASALEIDLLALLSKGDLSQNLTIQPGDTIYVSSGTGKRFYVLGQVGRPGPYEWDQEITVLEAIKLASGHTPKAALSRIQVRKNQGARQEVLKVDVGDIMKGKRKDDVVIEPGDIVVVPERWV
jgi:polysaccharide export outer membrane protein